MRLTFSAASFPVLLASTLLTTGVSFSTAVFNPCGSAVQAVRTFGTHGSDGDNGAHGQSGERGNDRTVEATGTPININLEGRDGEQGESGEHATRARCGHQSRSGHDLTAADGGDGGDGGQGGDGGDGGTLTAYYTDPAALKTLYVNAAGGDGAAGGRGGRGSDGCDCEDDDWQITTCTDGNCTTKDFDCEDGDHGHDGRRGRKGEDGQTGRVRLIQQSEPLAADNPDMESAIATFSTAPISLSRNLWETRSGAQSLFAIGSVIDDDYDRYTGRVDQQFQLIWDAARPQVNTAGNLAVSLDEQGVLQVTPQDDLWIDGELSTEQGLTTYRVEGVVPKSEAVQLSLGRNSGRGEQFVMSVIDTASTSDLVETSFHLRYYTDEGERRARFISRYDAAMPSDLITQDYNRFSVALGQLPISAQYLRPGTPIKMELTVTRSYAGHSATQVLTWNGQI
ncbi:MAG: collagen-like protein [Cyanobacteria bacterium P01_A01_bin.116]